MINRNKSKLFVIILVLLSILQSCAEMKSRTETETPVKTSQPLKKTSMKSLTKKAKVVDPAKEHMKAGDYQKAITVYRVAYRKHPNSKTLLGAYVKSIEKIKSDADAAWDKADFASAGRKYDLLLKNYSHFNGFEKKLSFNSNHLNENLDHCKKALFKQGFREYRKENLNGAIKLWQHLFDIDPQNPDIKKMLRTAKMQQKNLEEKE